MTSLIPNEQDWSKSVSQSQAAIVQNPAKRLIMVAEPGVGATTAGLMRGLIAATTNTIGAHTVRSHSGHHQPLRGVILAHDITYTRRHHCATIEVITQLLVEKIVELNGLTWEFSSMEMKMRFSNGNTIKFGSLDDAEIELLASRPTWLYLDNVSLHRTELWDALIKSGAEHIPYIWASYGISTDPAFAAVMAKSDVVYVNNTHPRANPHTLFHNVENPLFSRYLVQPKPNKD